MLDSFGIVKPVLGQYYLAIAESFAEPAALFLYVVTFREVTNLVVIDAHWECVNFYRPFSVNEHLAKAGSLAWDSANHTGQMLGVVYWLKPYHVGSMNAFEVSPAPWARRGA